MHGLQVKEWVEALTPLGALVAAFWALYTYSRAKKVEVARLQKGIFDDLFLSGKFTAIREGLDLNFAAALAPALKRVTSDEPLSEQDRKLLTELDNFLNLIEYVLYLERDKKLVSVDDRKALLGYWIGVVGSHPSLCSYVERYDYERLHACLSAAKTP